MKINGMRMSNYYIVNYLFNFTFYSMTAALFLLFGNRIFKISVFMETNMSLQIFIMIGWGLA